MMVDDFISVFRQVVNEFRILNEHFDSKANSKTNSYDVIFSSWLRDMNKRYHELLLSMHWSTSQSMITKNEILFDVRYKEEYFVEIKYKFDQAYVSEFVANVKDYLVRFVELVKKLQAFNKQQDFKQNPRTEEYDKIIPAWKKEVYESLTNTALDFHWGNKTNLITTNPLFFSVMFKDECLMEMKVDLLEEEYVERKLIIDEKEEDVSLF
jgi:hypothetical protein